MVATLYTPTAVGDELSAVNLNAQLTQLETAILARYNGMRRLVATTTLGANASVIDINSIPQTTKHLRLLMLLRTDLAGAGGDNPLVYFNNSHVAANYASLRVLFPSTVTNISAGGAGEMVMGLVQSAGMPANQFSPIVLDIQNYTSTTLWKALTWWSGINTDAAAQMWMGGGFWNVTNAITRIGFASNGGAQFITGCSYTVYGFD